MVNKYYYFIHGLYVESDIVFQELVPTEKHIPDLYILLGKVPERVEKKTDNSWGRYRFSKNKFCMYLNDIAEFYIENGNKIIIEPFEEADSINIKENIINFIFSIVLYQKNILTLHGSAVTNENLCLVFVGESGAGKSTICNEFVKRGYKFLSDDISVIDLTDKNKPVVQPSYPQIKLRKDIAIREGFNLEEMHEQINDYGKLMLNMEKCFSHCSFPLTAIIELVPINEDSVSLQQVRGTEKIYKIIKNTFYYTFLEQAPIDKNFFIETMNFVDKIPYYQVCRPKGEFTMDKQIKIIMDELCN